MVFDAPFLIRYISNQITLNPGDISQLAHPQEFQNSLKETFAKLKSKALEF